MGGTTGSDKGGTAVPDGLVAVVNDGTSTSRQPSRSDIAQAVASRLQHQNETPLAEQDRRQLEHKAKLRKHINELTASVNYEKASACLRLLHTLLENILQNPSEAKFRAFKASQPKINRDILSLEAGKAILVEVGFRTRIQDFQQEWFIPIEWNIESFGFKKIAWSKEMIGTKMQEFEDNAERVRSNNEREKVFESNRKSRALEEAREDRERVASRAIREKMVRKAAEERAAQEPIAAAAAAAHDGNTKPETDDGDHFVSAASPLASP